MPSLQFILGSAAVDHQAALLDHLAAQLAAHPTDRFFYLVPNHIKFSTEIDVLSQLKARQASPIYAQTQVQVLSFSRLAWFLLRDVPAFNAPRISPTGLTMVVAAIVKQLTPAQLRLFAKEAHQPGFIQDLTKQVMELRNANIAPEDYDQIKQRSAALAQAYGQTDAAFDDKLAVLFTVYQRFMAALGDQLATPDIYDLLIQALRQGDFSTTHFYLDRYNAQFSAKEEQVVEAMIENGATTTVSLVLDRPYRGSQVPDPNQLFYQPGLMYHRLARFAEQHGAITFLPDEFASRPRVAPALQEVERWLAATSQFTTPAPAPTLPQAVHFMTAPTRLAELNAVAAKIRQLVTHQHYRYRDFLVLTRRLDGYETMLQPVFAAHEIPVFNDNDRPMKTHPLVTLVLGLFQVLWGHFQLTDLMQVLKTGLLLPAVEVAGQPLTAEQFKADLYLTENWALKYGKSGASRLNTKTFEYTPHLEITPAMEQTALGQAELQKRAQLNRVKHYVKTELAPFLAQWRQAKNGRQAAQLLFEFLHHQGVEKQLVAWEQAAVEAGELALGQEPQQVWQLFCQLLDEYVLALGDQTPFNLTDFRDLLLVGFQTATYSQIPSTIDQVLVSESGITQTERRQVVFIIGATDDVMPTVQLEPGLLTPAERQRLAQGLRADQYLPVAGLEKIANEPFVNYLAMMTPQAELYLSAPLQGGEEEQVGLSPYLTGLAAHFNQPITALPATPVPQADFAAVAPFVSAPAATRSNFIRVRRLKQDNAQPLSSSWRLVVRLLNQLQPDRPPLLPAYHYQNEPQPLTPALAEQLYGHLAPELVAARAAAQQAGAPLPAIPPEQAHSTLYTSVSQLQTFYQNPYEYFLKYGLRLKKREEFEISPADSGTFYHNVMEHFIAANQPHLATLDEAALAKQTALALAWAESQQPLLVELSDEQRRFAYQLNHLKQVAAAMTRLLVNQAQLSTATPLHTEQTFGTTTAALPPLVHRLADQVHQVQVRGRIDRIDQIQTAQQTYQMVLDYKSGQRQFDLVRALSGLDLQLLTYLAALQNSAPTTKLAGAFYLRLGNEVLRASDLKRRSAVANTLQNHRYNGLILNDPDLLTAVDTELGQTGRGQLLKVSYTKSKQTYRANQGSALVTPAQLKWLLDQNTALITKAATAILTGVNTLAPYRLVEATTASNGLTNSDFLPIFAFDNVLDQDKFRDITLSEAAVKQQLQALDEPTENKEG